MTIFLKYPIIFIMASVYPVLTNFSNRNLFEATNIMTNRNLREATGKILVDNPMESSDLDFIRINSYYTLKLPRHTIRCVEMLIFVQ